MCKAAIRIHVFAFCCLALIGCRAQEDVLVLRTKTGDAEFRVEIAADDASRARGLMFRPELAPDAGMLFDFGQEQKVSFWMQNTLIPLDMIFATADGTIVKVHSNAQPLDSSAVSSVVPVRFVLEIPGGRSTQIGLEVNDKIIHPKIQAGMAAVRMQ